MGIEYKVGGGIIWGLSEVYFEGFSWMFLLVCTLGQKLHFYLSCFDKSFFSLHCAGSFRIPIREQQ